MFDSVHGNLLAFSFLLPHKFGSKFVTFDFPLYWGGGVLQEKLGQGVRTDSQNPYPIYDQNLRFSPPYLWPDQKFDTLFLTWLLDH